LNAATLPLPPPPPVPPLPPMAQTANTAKATTELTAAALAATIATRTPKRRGQSTPEIMPLTHQPALTEPSRLQMG
jgi:hypothetical protein